VLFSTQNSTLCVAVHVPLEQLYESSGELMLKLLSAAISLKKSSLIV
jgi:hypothetical protein